MGRMSDLHIEMQESGMLDDHPDQRWIPLKQHMVDGNGLSTGTLANEILFHYEPIQGRGDEFQDALELRKLIQALLDRHMTVLHQP